MKCDFNCCDWSKHFHIDNCFLSNNALRNDSVHGKRQPSPSLWVKKTQFDKQLAADIVWWCYHAQNRSPLWGAAYKWGLKIFFSSLFCGLLFSSQMRKWFAAGYSGGIPSTFFSNQELSSTLSSGIYEVLIRELTFSAQERRQNPISISLSSHKISFYSSLWIQSLFATLMAYWYFPI